MEKLINVTITSPLEGWKIIIPASTAGHPDIRKFITNGTVEFHPGPPSNNYYHTGILKVNNENEYFILDSNINLQSIFASTNFCCNNKSNIQKCQFYTFIQNKKLEFLDIAGVIYDRNYLEQWIQKISLNSDYIEWVPDNKPKNTMNNIITSLNNLSGNNPTLISQKIKSLSELNLISPYYTSEDPDSDTNILRKILFGPGFNKFDNIIVTLFNAQLAPIKPVAPQCRLQKIFAIILYKIINIQISQIFSIFSIIRMQLLSYRNALILHYIDNQYKKTNFC